eukprot:CAMPEP_0204897796 /NCGR_PEP_ID=MMETSP1397-20131031/921_1 /ASSEMBLY_ACC=CAM_ASM_000891 /TAXON_ID=49980 /ORGANISM="Climacostomum Climacostomum virens, Strain Stock W-24" /LENGTH=1426 /DNA_ID=CAMNT_0052065573 /DNA_START=152 /DNA_END=4432 /DNA_ORIENTATION=+
MTDVEYESFELVVEVVHYNSFFNNVLIGKHTIGLSTLHRNANHEFFNVWLTLLHEESGSEPKGYLQVNAFIVGENDTPPAHKLGDKAEQEEDEDEDELPIELLSPEQRRMRNARNKNIQVVGRPVFATKGYQFSVNIYKAEALVRVDPFEPSAFVSVRAGGFVEKTQTVKRNSNPSWNTRIVFPVFQPIMNDKIVVRMWDHKPLGRDRMIASIPEMPSDRDFFNLTALMSRGGVMPCRWFNLYGRPAEENTFSNDLRRLFGMMKMTYHGTSYLGRVLLSMTITPNDEPELTVDAANPYLEPLIEMHRLNVTLYDLKNPNGLGSRVWCRVSIGPYISENKPAIKKDDEGEIFYTWGGYSGARIKEIYEPFPLDKSQVPDVVIDLYTDGLLGDRRVGYLRLPVSELPKDANPRWYSFKSIDTHSDIQGYSPGLILAAITFRIAGDPPISNKSRPRRKKFYLHYFVYAGYNLAPQLEEASVNATYSIFIGGKEFKQSPERQKEQTKYPHWNDYEIAEVNLYSEGDDFSFEQNLRFEVKTSISSFKFYANPLIGQFTIPLRSCTKIWDDPQFFHLVNPDFEGQSQGRILASFYITEDRKKSNVLMENDNPEPASTYCDIKIALVGIRNLKPAYTDVKVQVSLPEIRHEEGDKAFREVVGTKGTTSNPNFEDGQIIEFKDIPLPEKALLLPTLKIKVIDDSFFMPNECFTYVPLIPYVPWLTDMQKREAMELYNRSFDRKDMIEQVPVAQQAEEIRRNPDISYTDLEDELEDDCQDSDTSLTTMPSDPMREMIHLFEPKNSRFTKRIQFDKTEQHFAFERMAREDKAKRLIEEIEEMDKRKDAIRDKGRVDEDLEAQIRDRRKELEETEKGIMSEPKFFKVDEDDVDDEHEYDYKREVLKNQKMESTLCLPYSKYSLFVNTKNPKRMAVTHLGDDTGAVLKLSVGVLLAEKDTVINYLQKKENADGEEPDDDKYKLNIFHRLFKKEDSEAILREFRRVSTYKVRVYLLRGVSISAVENSRDLVALASGNDSMSNAKAYPEIILGGGDEPNIRYICESEDPKEGTLNPEFFKCYELTAVMPRDVKLVINLWNKSFLFPDALIGATDIDIEDRYLGEKYFTEMLMVKRLKAVCKRTLDTSTSKEERDFYGEIKNDLKLRNGRLIDKGRKPVPVEYRNLMHDKKSTPQGLLELFVEVLDESDAKKIPIQHIAKRLPEEYEMRLIIWRVEGIPKGDKEAIDIYLKCQFDPTGWLGESLQKETDTHLGSEDGHGVYNWRMKFNFTLPCTFPRLRIIAYDFETFDTDEILTEVVVDLSKYFRKLSKEGRFTLDEEWIFMHLPNLPNTNGGKLQISLSIISKAEADNRPVGEGRDEPNRDPELETPEEGRGVGDYLKGTILDVSKWNFNLGLIKKLIALLSVGFVLFILFVYPGLAVK